LGEQAPSVLRCKKMPEIIFGGTANRKSLSYCEVSLTLDNTKKFYSVDYEEVVVTRKLYRSGESEYFINRNAVRLKDVLDLFRDSGVGIEGYSIIGQGQIEEIMSQKPEARREIFEEAAGITKHKAKKKESERKLEHTRDNLLRINDILTEVSEKLGPLEKEAADAAKARELKQNLKNLDVAYFLHQCENSAADREKISARLDAVLKEYAAAEENLKKLSSDYNIAMMEIANGDIYMNRLRENITELMVSSERIAGDARMYVERLNNLRKEASEISAEIAASEARLRDKEREKEDKISSYNEGAARLAEKKKTYEEIQGEFKTLSDSVEKQEKAIEKTSALLMDSMGRLSEIDQNKVKFEIERDILRDSSAASKSDYKEKKAALDALKREREKLSSEASAVAGELEKRSNERALANKNYADSLAELREAELKKNELELRKNELATKIKLTEEYIKDYAGYQEVVRRLMLEAQGNPKVASMIKGTVGEILTVPKDLQYAVEVALGFAIQNIIVETEYDASELIDILKEKGYGRATFLPISAVRSNSLSRDYDAALNEDGVIGVASDLIKYDKKFAGIVSNLLGRTVIVEDKEIGIRIAKKYRYGFRVVTLDGVQFSQTGAITGGSQPAKSSRILSRETELEEFGKRLKNTIKEIDTAAQLIAELKTESGEMENAAKVIDARVRKLELDLSNLNTRLSAADGEVGKAQAGIDKYLEAEKNAEARLNELSSLIKNAEKNKESLTSEKTSAEDFIAEAKDKFFNGKQALDTVRRQVTDALVAVNSVQNELDSLNRDLGMNKAETAHINSALLDLKARRATNEKEASAAEDRLKNAVVSPSEQKKLEEMKREVSDVEELKKKTQLKVADLDAKKAAASSSLAEISERKVREMGALERIDLDIENLSVRIRQDYDMDYSAAKAYGETAEKIAFNPSKAVQETNSLRRKIEKLGPVNELAEQQFGEAKERYETLKKQYGDLTAAERDLVKIINDITTEMVQKFSESFKKINDNFQEVYRELFGGGSARLELEREEGVSVLDAGIEIMAEPPGKKLTRISLLSGGERALTAIAILFAIIKLKPMPFSILDEIEAALDEANAGLFAQYLRKFSTYTQFIVVTHRKPTMALADMLYGVTMQEKGVSKLVSVRLEEAEKVAEAN